MEDVKNPHSVTILIKGRRIIIMVAFRIALHCIFRIVQYLVDLGSFFSDSDPAPSHELRVCILQRQQIVSQK